MTINRQWLINGDPTGRAVVLSDFKKNETELAPLESGQIRVRNMYLEFSPSLKGQMENHLDYAAPTQKGEVMRGRGIGRVIDSRCDTVKIGDMVMGYLGWQDFASIDASAINVVPDDQYLRARLGPLGSSGMTAYFGLLDAGKPKVGDIVLISGAAGAVGSLVGQIAKIHGCTVIGVAGGADKCRYLTQKAGLDGAIDYKSENLETAIKTHAPKGVHIVFDNIGGEFLDAALTNLKVGAKVVLCGAMTRYNAATPPPGPTNYFNLILRRATMQGILSPDYKEQFPKAIADIKQWMDSGDLMFREDIQEGFDNIPKTFLRLFTGENQGKQLIKLSD